MNHSKAATGSQSLSGLYENSQSKQNIHNVAKEYLAIHHEEAGGTLEARKSKYTTMVNQYYDLVTDFYEFGWGKSFHFAPRYQGESFQASLARHEHYLA